MLEIALSDLRFGIYNRKSSDTEDKQVQSIETQGRENRATADYAGLSVIEEQIFDETKSAFVPGRERFAEMVRAIGAGKINGVIVIHPNRLARNPVDAGTLIELMDRKKLLAIKTPSKAYFPTPTDKMMLGLEFLMSKKDSDDKSDFVKNGLKTKALKGLPSGAASIGFLNDRLGEVGNKKWIVDRERYPLVETLLHRFLQGDISAGRLHKWAIGDLRLTTPKHKRIGGALISRSRMYTILQDPIYAGFFFQDGVRYPLDASLPRMITEDQHCRILQLLGGRHIPKTKKHFGTYTGFIKGADGNFIGQDPKFQVICDCGRKFAYIHRDHCPQCGVRIGEMNSPKYLVYVYYYNVKRKKSGSGAKYISETAVNAFVKDFARNVFLSQEQADWSRKYLNELRDEEVREHDTIVARRDHITLEIEAKKARYREMLAERLITPEEYRSDVERLKRRSSGPSVGVERTERWYRRANEITDLAQELVQTMGNGTVDAKRRILGALGSNLVWDEKKLSILNKKSVQALLDGLNRVRCENTKFELENGEVDAEKNGASDPFRPSLLRTWDNVRQCLLEEIDIEDRGQDRT
jgi:DNA invertase Pin-like site-specific DNA recombinase